MEDFTWSFGKAFRERRMAMGLGLSQVCGGICGASMLSRIEGETATPGYDLARALMERLGLAYEKYVVLLSHQEIEMERRRGEIVLLGERFFWEKDAPRGELREEALARLQEMEALVKRPSSIVRQFVAAQRVLFQEPEGQREWLERGEVLTQILRITLPRFHLEDTGGMLCSYFELELIAHMIIAFVLGGELEKADRAARQLDDYLTAHYPDRRPPIDILPFVPVVIAMEQKRWTDALALADAARRVPARNWHMPQAAALTEIMARCRLELGDGEAAGELSRQAGYLRLALGTREAAQTESCAAYVGIRAESFAAFGSYIKECRQRRGLTQAQVCAGICDASTYSRIELGQQTPSSRVAAAIMKRLGQVPYRFFFRGPSVFWKALHTLVDEYEGRFYNLSGWETARLWEDYGPVLPEIDRFLRGCGPMMRGYGSPHVYLLQIAMSGESTERQIERLTEELHDTHPALDLDRIFDDETPIGWAETDAVAKLAYLYRDLGDQERFLSIIRQIIHYLQYVGSDVERYAQMKPGEPIMYATLLAEVGNWEEAIRVAETGRRISAANHRADDTCYYLKLLVRCCIASGDRERGQSYYHQALALCAAFGWEDHAREVEAIGALEG